MYVHGVQLTCFAQATNALFDANERPPKACSFVCDKTNSSALSL